MRSEGADGVSVAGQGQLGSGRHDRQRQGRHDDEGQQTGGVAAIEHHTRRARGDQRGDGFQIQTLSSRYVDEAIRRAGRLEDSRPHEYGAPVAATALSCPQVSGTLASQFSRTYHETYLTDRIDVNLRSP